MDIRLAAVLMCCLGSGGGCGLIMVGDPVQEMDLTSQDDAEENLKAIRAMLADQESQRSDERLSDTSRQPTPPAAAPSLIEPSYGQRPAPSPSSSVGRTEAPAKLQSSSPVPSARYAGLSCSRLYDPCARWTGLFGNHSLYTGRNGRPALRRTMI